MAKYFWGMVMSKQQGFTLIEVMVSVVVIAVILAFAVPSMQLMQANSRMASAANDLATDLKQGRSEAIANRNNFTVSAQDGEWSKGWKVEFSISATAGEGAALKVEKILEHSSLPLGVTVVTKSEDQTTIQSVNPLVFNGNTGRVTHNNQPVDVVFAVCDSKVDSESGYNVVLNRFGRVMIQRHVCSG